MAAPTRVKTVWFKKEGERPAEEIATALATTIWRMADRAVDNLSKADYDIITPQRGFKIIGELTAFAVHYVDRVVFPRMDDRKRGELVSAIGVRLAEIMEDNILDVTGGARDPDYDYQQGYIDMLNNRMTEYAHYDFPDDKPSFQALRYLSLQIREGMESTDQTWIQDQIMDIEMPEILGTVKKQVDGFYPTPA
ncbi:hypothetical protein EZJ19_06440 [Parasulfuritortus cantonensis]|uniref:Uncharacterized protein n=1 Tax=Parasulfuritortus cantonensis TaxID=2528202 RepID=A0A4R1BF20_9PROT|nr:glycosyltransferase [Parasulfuritortus cantonensis]TCJ15703.1 hypothetical protein EZJ19_06440 [Parasulfuritortus cantonensis]